jgi:hypothetical protein
MRASKARGAAARVSRLRARDALHRGRCLTVAVAAGQRREADLRGGGRGPWTPALWGARGGPQPLPVRMRGGTRELLVDLPVDVSVMLDGEERASRGEQRPGAAGKSGVEAGNEHAFDCMAATGRNVGSIMRAVPLRSRIRIVKPFLSAAPAMAIASGVYGCAVLHALGRSFGPQRVMKGCNDC